MALKAVLFTAFLFAAIAIVSMYAVVHLSEIKVGCLHISVLGSFLIYVGSGSLSAYLFRAGRKL